MTTTRWRLLGTFAAVLAAAWLVRGAMPPAPAEAQASAATYAIDADPTNGAPCSTIDAARTVNTNTSNLTAAICLVNPNVAPGDGTVSGFSPKFTYDTTLMTAVNAVSDNNTDLDANPNFNQAMGGTWDCNLFNSSLSQPVATPLVAMGCTASGSVNAAATVLVATLTYSTGATTGTSNLVWDGGAAFSLGNGTTFLSCGNDLTCADAAITVQVPAGQNTPTATNTSAPPTATATPCPNCTPTATPTVLIRSVTPTATATGAASATVPSGGSATAVPPTSGPSGGSATPGGAPGAGGITPPGTGTGPSTGGSGLFALVALLAAIGVALSGVGLAGWRLTRRGARRHA